LGYSALTREQLVQEIQAMPRTLAALLLATGLSAMAAGQTPYATASKPAAAPVQGRPVPIPRSVFIATMDAEFKERDADKNGTVTKKEIEGFQRALFARANQERLNVLFQRLDTDKNGQISPAEFAALQLPAPSVNATPLFSQVDLNRDGQVTLVEYRTGKLRNFDSMDSDKDGTVSIAEMKAGGLIKQ
jgi:Ca2+-binding EF-hand superfamily protein